MKKTEGKGTIPKVSDNDALDIRPGAGAEPRLYVIEGEAPKIRFPKLTVNQLDKMCDLKMSRAALTDLEAFLKENPAIFGSLIVELSGRDFKNELPVPEQTFLYQRNLQEVERLRESARTLRQRYAALLAHGATGIDLNAADDQPLIKDAIRLLALEQRKAAWLDEKFNPVVYARPISVARGEVNQFLIKHLNTANLDVFRNTKEADIEALDPLTYLRRGHPSDSAGVYNAGTIRIRVPAHYSDREEWEVYLIAVHELVHYIGDIAGGLARELRANEHKEMDEALTQILTYLIAMTHLDKQKTPLQSEQKINFLAMPYAEYAFIVKQIFPKIPLEDFVDALFSRSGRTALSKKFDEVSGKPNSLVTYAESLRKGFMHPRERR